MLFTESAEAESCFGTAADELIATNAATVITTEKINASFGAMSCPPRVLEQVLKRVGKKSVTAITLCAYRRKL